MNQGLADKFRDCDFTFGPDHSASACALAAGGAGETTTSAGMNANPQVDDKTADAQAKEKEKSVRSKSECAPPAFNLLVPALVAGAASRSPTRVAGAGGGGSTGALPQPGAMGMLSLSSDFLQAKYKRRDTLAVSHFIISILVLVRVFVRNSVNM